MELGSREALTVRSMRCDEWLGLAVAGAVSVLGVFLLTTASILIVAACKHGAVWITYLVWLLAEVATAVITALASGCTISMSIIGAACVACYTLPPSAIIVRVIVASLVSAASIMVSAATLFYAAGITGKMSLYFVMIGCAAFSVGCASAWAVGVMSLIERDTHSSGWNVTSIRNAVRQNNHHLLALLVRLHAGLEQRDLDLALIHAVKFGYPECTIILLKAGASANTQDYSHNTPLLLAAETNCIR